MSSTDQFADLESHHIEGYAIAAQERGIHSQFRVPLVSHIDGSLWTGGCRDGVRLPDAFQFVVSLYPWERYRLGPDTERIEIRLYDSADIASPGELAEIAEQVTGFMARGQTLVHCQAGLNRSGLIAGLALVRNGMSPAEAVALMRERRSPLVLCNETFEAFLLRQAA